MEFHVSRASRAKYGFDDLLFSTDGNVIFANFQAARVFAAKMNALRDQSSDEPPVSPGQLNALGLIDEIFHLVISDYFKEQYPSLRHRLQQELTTRLGEKALNESLLAFTRQFPPLSVYRDGVTESDYLSGYTQGVPNSELVIEEMLMLWLANSNPAASPFSELFEAEDLIANTAYRQIIDGIQTFFKRQPVFGPENQDLVTLLRTPALRVPQSLSGQLEYIRTHWSKWIEKYLMRLLGSIDMLKEETKITFAGPGPTLVPEYPTVGFKSDKDDPLAGLSEEERFSPDSDWMPKVVMIAKNSYVWLSQLSEQYGRQIERLDQIPDETLDELARWGFNGLWLIGLWERSEASKRIKQMCGNPDAVSSAYSLKKYEIADRLGGSQSYEDLKRRCAARGIRLASDMVPNHMGIDSDWVYEHPEWFVQRAESPFPAYSFNGPNLSDHPGISINIDDHYYTRTDAAVVFKRYDHGSGVGQFIYHGNDGTSMPWNDTAQLNYLKPEVREAVIQTILAVARKSPIIRFDAAMTLTKKHYQRLWYPEPGSGGDIPSRADHAMTKEAFDAAMPEEFWREVVERVSQEVPDTLLLAEAFWLMEGYFVRTLGMHRVYNSAFMHMLRNEENSKYRQLIKNTLVYDPQILKRYVNFMNNPDEKTAVEQFGKGDKYFGVCTVLATMPGLPMFGHGQIEGYSEKYGMEYYRPYWDEQPDLGLVEHHQRVIFPLLHRRRLFAEVDNFFLYDFLTENGSVDENVFAYSNAADGHATLTLYNNRFGDTSGRIHISAPTLLKQGDNSRLITKDVLSALQLDGGIEHFVIFWDAISKLSYIRPLDAIRSRGFSFNLGAYEHRVLMDFKVVSGPEYGHLYDHIKDRGVQNLEAVKHELSLGPALAKFHRLVEVSPILDLLHTPEDHKKQKLTAYLEDQKRNIQKTWNALGVTPYSANELEEPSVCNCFHEQLLKEQGEQDTLGYNPTVSIMKPVWEKLARDKRQVTFMFLLKALKTFQAVPGDDGWRRKVVREFLHDDLVKNILTGSLTEAGFMEYDSWKKYQALLWLTHDPYQELNFTEASALSVLDTLENSREFAEFIGLNTYNNVRWFDLENYDQALWLMQADWMITQLCKYQDEPSRLLEVLVPARAVFEELSRAALNAEYQWDKVRAALSEKPDSFSARTSV